MSYVDACEHVFIHIDKVTNTIYEGPHKVERQFRKYLVVDGKMQKISFSLYRVKPTQWLRRWSSTRSDVVTLIIHHHMFSI